MPGRLREGERLLEIQETPRPPRRRVRDGERIGNCLSTTGNPHRRVLDGKQPLALLFLLLCPRRRCLLFNLLDFANGVTRNISQF